MTLSVVGEPVERLDFAGSTPAILREAQVQRQLGIREALGDLRLALREPQQTTCPRLRLEGGRSHAWMHTLRASLPRFGVAGGKDYTSLGFDTPSMWVSVVSTRTGEILALIEAEYLSRARTAAASALATELLAPAEVGTLVHFGAGRISELLVKGVLDVRPSIRRVVLVRRDPAAPKPAWVDGLGEGRRIELAPAEDAPRLLEDADVVTTATSSRTPVIPAGHPLPRLRHLNLVGSNHLQRSEIADDLARRCLAPDSYLVVDDTEQAALEAGDFAALSKQGAFRWQDVPTLSKLVADPKERTRAAAARFTAYESLGTALLDLAAAVGVLRRLGLLALEGAGEKEREP